MPIPTIRACAVFARAQSVHAHTRKQHTYNKQHTHTHTRTHTHTHTHTHRSTFLNVLNEKQWTTNCNALVEQLNQKDLGLVDPLCVAALPLIPLFAPLSALLSLPNRFTSKSVSFFMGDLCHCDCSAERDTHRESVDLVCVRLFVLMQCNIIT